MTGHKGSSASTIEPMQQSPGDAEEDSAGKSSRFWLKLFENLFRRLPFYLLPVLLMGSIGVVLAQRASAEYSSTATLDASNNPLVEVVDVRGDDPLFRQTSAQSTANFIGEQLRTDVFVREVASRAGLAEALDSNTLTNSRVRSKLSARANGDSLILISARWADPATAQLLVDATIDTYRNYVVDTVAADSLAAEEFFTELQTRARGQADAAQEELDAYVSRLPPIRQDEVRTIEQELAIQRLNNALERAETNVENATGEIEAAQLEVAKSRSEAGLSIRVIDPAQVPEGSEPWLFQAISIILTFLMLGFLISATALIISTAVDRTIQFAPDVVEHTGSPYVTSVPVLKSIRARSKRAAASSAIDSDSTVDGHDSRQRDQALERGEDGDQENGADEDEDHNDDLADQTDPEISDEIDRAPDDDDELAETRT